MSRRPTPEMHELKTSVPRGFDGFWLIIRALDADGPWTTAMVVERTNVLHQSVGDFVVRLVKGGYAACVGEEPNGKLHPIKRYRLRQTPSEAPRLRRDGSECLPTRQEQMWRAMRALAQFDYRELAFAASTDTVAVSPVAARDYIARLSHAGYLTTVRAAKPGTPAIWRLRPAMNTGPLAPLVMRTKFVWDANRQAVMGAAEPAREVV